MPHATTNALVAALGLSALLLAPAVPQANAELASPNVHVVQPGETLVQVADRLGADPNALISLNKLDNPDVLTVGQTLSVSGSSAAGSASASSSQQAARANPTPASAGAVVTGSMYTVADGDTLWAIARQFGTSLPALVEANALDNPDALRVGSQLRIPGEGSRPAPPPPPLAASGPTSGAYTVQAGDTLLKISRQVGVSLGALVKANGLDDPDRLSAGMVLKLPGGPPTAGAATAAAQPHTQTRQHVVRVGETLKDIAAEEKVDLGVLIDVNSIDNPELLRVGQVVAVPPSPPDGPGDGSSAVASDGKPGMLVAAAAPTPPTPLPAAPAPKPTNQPASASAPGPAPKPANQAAAAGTAASAPATASTPQPSALPTRSQPAGPTASPPPGRSQPASPAAPAPAPAAPAGPAPTPGEGPAEYAQRFLGARYVFGGSSPAGFDCSGFVWYVARQLGKPISRGMQGEYNSGPHPKKEELKPGDMVFFQNTYKPGLSHNGFYLGNGKFIHAADERSGVTISDINAPFWSSHWFGATRLS